MARTKNSLESVQITVSVTPQVRDLIESLTQEGLHGKSHAETVNILVLERLKELIHSGQLHRKPTSSSPTPQTTRTLP